MTFEEFRTKHVKQLEDAIASYNGESNPELANIIRQVSLSTTLAVLEDYHKNFALKPHE